MNEVQRLKDRIEQLQAVIGADADLTGRIREAFELDQDQAVILGMLYKRSFVTRDGLYTVLYGDLPDCQMPNDKTLDARTFKLRKVLNDRGVEIMTKCGEGWSISSGAKEIVRRAVEEPTAEEIEQRYQDAFGLQPKQARILALMMERDFVTAVSLLHIVNGYGAARLQIHRMRRTLQVYQIEITGRYGKWSLSPRARISLSNAWKRFL